MTLPTVYVASKSCHGLMWRNFREAARASVRITSTWIDEDGEGESEDLADLWSRCVDEAAFSSALIAYHEDGEIWKGAFLEIGVALANGRPVYVVGDPPGSWVNHPLVHRCPTLGDAFAGVMG